MVAMKCQGVNDPRTCLFKKLWELSALLFVLTCFPQTFQKAGRIRTTFFDVVSDEVVIDEDVNIPGCTSILDPERISYVEDSLLRDQSKGDVRKCHDATDKPEHDDVVVNLLFDLSAQVCVRQLSQVSEHTLRKVEITAVNTSVSNKIDHLVHHSLLEVNVDVNGTMEQR